MINKKWIYSEVNIEDVQAASIKYSIPEIIAHIILSRGYKFTEFLDKPEFHDPFLMKDMDKAVERIVRAVQSNEKITVYADYDVDGVTASSIIIKYLSELGCDCNLYMPSRDLEGYGMNMEAMDKIRSDGTNLIITVDCGITSINEVAYANDMGMDVIITDHHSCYEQIPDALAIINTKQPDCTYPFKELSGVGVAFKLIQALNSRNTNDGNFSSGTIEGSAPCDAIIQRFISIVCLGTVADVVPILGENRAIVDMGLKFMKQTSNLGLKALIDVCGLGSKEMNATTISFTLAPRINAVGRIGDASLAVKLFTTDDNEEAIQTAVLMDNENKSRQQTEQSIFEDAMSKISETNVSSKDDAQQPDDDKIIVLYNQNWHHGVIGIVCSHLVSRFHKPCILISLDGDIGRASCRSIKGFNMFDALSLYRQYFIKFGGHELAAGFSISKENLDSFVADIKDYAKKTLNSENLVPVINIDCRLDAQDLNIDTINKLDMLSPFGAGNAVPIFSCLNLKITAMRTLTDGKHLKLTLCSGGVYVDAIGFNMGGYSELFSVGDIVDTAFALEINSYNNSAQMVLKDLKRCEITDQLAAVYKYVKKYSINGIYIPDFNTLHQSVSMDSGICADSSVVNKCMKVLKELGLFSFGRIGDKFCVKC